MTNVGSCAAEVETGKLDIEHSPFRLNLVIEDTMKMLGFATQKKVGTALSDNFTGSNIHIGPSFRSRRPSRERRLCNGRWWADTTGADQPAHKRYQGVFYPLHRTLGGASSLGRSNNSSLPKVPSHCAPSKRHQMSTARG